MITGARFIKQGPGGHPMNFGSVVLLPSGEVSILVPSRTLHEELVSGVLGADKQSYTPADGVKFINAVIRQYSGSYIQAVPIQSAETGTL